jgi:hypothetical protein
MIAHDGLISLVDPLPHSAAQLPLLVRQQVVDRKKVDLLKIAHRDPRLCQVLIGPVNEIIAARFCIVASTSATGHCNQLRVRTATAQLDCFRLLFVDAIRRITQLQSRS